MVGDQRNQAMSGRVDINQLVSSGQNQHYITINEICFAKIG